jgi:hypothetical protein
MLVGRVVHDHVHDQLHTALVDFFQRHLEIFEMPIGGVNGVVAGNVVAVVAQRRSVYG